MARDTEAPPPAAGAGVGVGPAVEAGADRPSRRGP